MVGDAALEVLRFGTDEDSTRQPRPDEATSGEAPRYEDAAHVDAIELAILEL